MSGAVQNGSVRMSPEPSAPAEGIFAIPNLLTLVRLPLAAVVWIDPASMPFMLSIIAVAALTDVLDGWFARTMRRRRARLAGREPGTGTSPVGAWLDPLCDKAFVLSVVLAVSVALSPPLSLVLLIAARDIVMIPLVLAYRLSASLRDLDVDLSAGPFGKLATVCQFAAIIALLAVPEWKWHFAWLAAATGIAAIASYFLRALRAFRGRHAPAGDRATQG